MKKLLFIIIAFTLLLSRSSTLASATDPSYNCIFDSTTDTCRNTSSCPGGYLPIDGLTEFEACVNKCSSFPTSSNFLLYCKSQFSTSPPNVSCQAPASCVPSSTTCYQASTATCTGDRFCCEQKNPPPTSQNLDCKNQGGECRLESLGCSKIDNEKGIASQQCRIISNYSYSYMCCVPTNPDASTPPGSTPPPIDPGGYNSLAASQCTGKALADYMNAVIDGVKSKNLTHIKLLSPAFNMTSDTFSGIISSMDTAGANFAGLDGIAGNLYDVSGRGMSSWLDEKTAQFPASAKDKSIYLTEAGAKDVADKTIDRTTGLKNLNTEINKLIDRKVLAINLFNAFGTNSDFNTFALSHNQPGNDDMTIVCDGTTCPKPVGVNSAAGFSQGPTFYSDAKALNMGFTVEIARAGSLDAAMAGITSAHNKSMTPIIRIGVGSDSGGFDNPQTYVDFLASIDSQVSQTVFAIAGPNEPDSETWAAPSCQSITPAKGSPLAAGFTPLKYKCDEDTRDKPEFHPLRPYPGSPCDPLIPRSVPEAPLDPNLKYNTFACGSSLTPSKEEVFDPYGDNSQYEALTRGGYAHTWCEPRPPFTTKTQVTCYRTSEFDVTVDFKNANLGILGNTQDNLTDAQKVNEYLSWYLTGTPQIGDQLPIDPKNPSQISRVVNFSGPLRKLIPFDLQNIAKSTIVKSADIDVHNYIVGCQKDVDFDYFYNAFKAWLNTLESAFNLFWEIIWTIPTLPGDIYHFITTFTDAAAQLIPILQDFTLGDLPKIQEILVPLGETQLYDDLVILGEASAEYLHELGDFLAALNLDVAVSCQSSTEYLRLKQFADHLPPDPTDPKYKGDSSQYWDDYYWWRGMINIPLIGPVDFINQNIWSQLFQNVPFSSMEDIPGEVTLSVFRDPAYDQQTQNITNPVTNPQTGLKTAPLELIIKSATLAAP